MKTHVLMISKVFPKGHPHEGDFTHFDHKIQNGRKIHTIRAGVLNWSKKIMEVQNGDAIISVRHWTDKPYRSKQVELFCFDKRDHVGFELINMNGESGIITIMDDSTENAYFPTLFDLAHNDGLFTDDFNAWFHFPEKSFVGIIIHFTKFRYAK